jgi:Planctomycete cytochrome C
MKYIIAILSSLGFILILTYTGCKDQITASDVDKVVIPDSNVSYSKYLQPVFNIKCASTGCHEDATRAGGISLTSCANTKSDLSVVVPGYPDNSRLVWAVEGIGNYPMPPVGYPPLTQNQIQGVKTWIKEGADCN